MIEESYHLRLVLMNYSINQSINCHPIPINKLPLKIRAIAILLVIDSKISVFDKRLAFTLCPLSIPCFTGHAPHLTPVHIGAHHSPLVIYEIWLISVAHRLTAPRPSRPSSLPSVPLPKLPVHTGHGSMYAGGGGEMSLSVCHAAQCSRVP